MSHSLIRQCLTFPNHRTNIQIIIHENNFKKAIQTCFCVANLSEIKKKRTSHINGSQFNNIIVEMKQKESIVSIKDV